jgi:hypothetical protein
MVQRNWHILRAKQLLLQYGMVRTLSALFGGVRGFPESEECVNKLSVRQGATDFLCSEQGSEFRASMVSEWLRRLGSRD